MSTENLWAPWRMDYLRQLESSGDLDAPELGSETSSSTCFICDAVAGKGDSEHARQRLVLQNDDRGVILLNRYPYTNGHLLIAPIAHVMELSDLESIQRTGLIDLVALSEQLLRVGLNPQGLNVGINIGRCAGAGLPGHLHVHVVPRWGGDTNFMQVTGQVRVIPQALEESFSHLSETLRKLIDVLH